MFIHKAKFLFTDRRWFLLCGMLATGLSSGCMTSHGHHHQCTSCGTKICVLDVSVGEETIDGFEVKAKDICVPPVLFPWSDCPPKHCGRVREICVLEEAEEDRKVCEYQWSVKRLCQKCQTPH